MAKSDMFYLNNTILIVVIPRVPLFKESHNAYGSHKIKLIIMAHYYHPCNSICGNTSFALYFDI